MISTLRRSAKQSVVRASPDRPLHGWAQNGAATNYRITWKVPNLL